MIAIIGAGGHGKCVYECLFRQGLKIIGFFDDDPAKEGNIIINGAKVIGTPGSISQYPEADSIFVAVGDNRSRTNQFTYYKAKEYLLPNAIHPGAYISDFAKIGAGNFIMGPAVINPGSTIGDCCIINTSATVGHDCILGNGVQIGPGVNVAGGCVLKEGVFVGVGAKIGPEVTLGAWSVIGAGSVVLRDIPDYSFCAGVPAVLRKNNGIE